MHIVRVGSISFFSNLIVITQTDKCQFNIQLNVVVHYFSFHFTQNNHITDGINSVVSNCLSHIWVGPPKNTPHFNIGILTVSLLLWIVAFRAGLSQSAASVQLRRLHPLHSHKLTSCPFPTSSNLLFGLPPDLLPGSSDLSIHSHVHDLSSKSFQSLWLQSKTSNVHCLIQILIVSNVKRLPL